MSIQLFTSYYAGPKKGLQVSVSRREPKGYIISHSLKELAPHGWMLAPHVKQFEYEKEYVKILAKTTPEAVLTKVADWCNFTGQKEVTFLCWEKPGDFCHRHLIAAWLMDAGYEVNEIGAVDSKKAKVEVKDAQLSLF